METEQKQFTREEILQELITILNNNQNEDFTDITEETIIPEKFPEMDDLDRVEIIMEIETKFSVDINDEEAMEVNPNDDDISFNYKINSVKGWIDFILEKITAKKD